MTNHFDARLVVSLIIIGLSGWAPVNAQSSAKTFEQSVEFAAGSRLALETGRGSVKITSWENDTVEIIARIEMSDDGDSARRLDAVARTTVEVRGSRRSVRIRSNYADLRGGGDDDWWRAQPFVHYEIRAPRQLDLDLVIDGADTTLTGFEGRLIMELDRSDLAARDLTGTITVALIRGALVAHDLSGSIALALDRGERTTLDGVSGSLDLDLTRTSAALRQVDIRDDSRIKIDRGDLDLQFVDEQTLTLVADIARRAELVSDPPFTVQSSDQRVSGTLNGGGPTLRLEADRGQVRLRTR
ncbi:MAG: hypothetical protein O3A25_11400 [Acidobacteria bacterium]|nr:hypothetical protein [Acidobacteriota bacterium]